MELHVYFDVRQLPNETVGTHVVSPHASLVLEYDPSCQFETESTWYTSRQRNAYTGARVPVLSTSAWGEEFHDMMTVEWLDIENIIQQVKISGSRAELPTRQRNVQRLHKYPTDISSDGDIAWRRSSRAFHSFWVSTDDDSQPWLRMVPLFPHKGDPPLGWDVSEPIHIFKLPLHWDAVARLLGFCDETTTLIIVTNASVSGCCPPALRFFQY